MKRKSFIFGLILVLVGTLLSACGTSGSQTSPSSGEGTTENNNQPTDEKEEQKVYTVATDSNFVPFEYMNQETGEMEGFDIDLIKAIADEIGINIEFQTLEFSGLIAGMKSGRFDIGIAGITITDERKEEIDFSDPYYDAGIMVVVQSDNEEINSMDDLNGKQVATRTGSTTYDYLMGLKGDTHPDMEIVPFPGIVEAYMELRSGRVDAVVYDSPNAQYYVNQKANGELKTVGDIVQAQQYGIAFEQGSEIVDDVNEALAKFKENGTYDDIYEKWFGERPYGTEK